MVHGPVSYCGWFCFEMPGQIGRVWRDASPSVTSLQSWYLMQRIMNDSLRRRARISMEASSRVLEGTRSGWIFRGAGRGPRPPHGDGTASSRKTKVRRRDLRDIPGARSHYGWNHSPSFLKSGIGYPHILRFIETRRKASPQFSKLEGFWII